MTMKPIDLPMMHRTRVPPDTRPPTADEVRQKAAWDAFWNANDPDTAERKLVFESVEKGHDSAVRVKNSTGLPRTAVARHLAALHNAGRIAQERSRWVVAGTATRERALVLAALPDSVLGAARKLNLPVAKVRAYIDDLSATNQIQKVGRQWRAVTRG